MRSADLHLHSTASDGSDTPAEVVRRAAAMGFTAIALADHDTMGGVPEAAEEAERAGLELIPAVEYSTLDAADADREIHILGYGLDPADPTLRGQLARLVSGRSERAQLMVERLAELGVHVDWSRVREIAGDENVGRPHIARAMQEAGHIRDVGEAFTPELIATGGRAYVERVRITPEQAIAQIRAAGGVAVLAHPGRFRNERDGVAVEAIARYVSAGLGGIEAYYTRHTDEMVALYKAMALRFELLVTGGSDDHGRNADEASMGRIRLPYAYVERLKETLAKMALAKADGGSLVRSS